MATFLLQKERAYSSPDSYREVEHQTHYLNFSMALVYILYSKKIDGYYIGYTTEGIEERIHKHNTKFYLNKYTAQTSDWELYLKIDCQSEEQSRKIELHIKNMKSRKYITDLKIYPEMTQNLLKKNI